MWYSGYAEYSRGYAENSQGYSEYSRGAHSGRLHCSELKGRILLLDDVITAGTAVRAWHCPNHPLRQCDARTHTHKHRRARRARTDKQRTRADAHARTSLRRWSPHAAIRRAALNAYA
jgi:hypothetical protein